MFYVRTQLVKNKSLTFVGTNIRVKYTQDAEKLCILVDKRKFLKGGDIMFCSNCGKQVEDGYAFCSSCGKPLKPLNAGDKMNYESQDHNNVNSRQTNIGAQYYKDQYTVIERPVINRGLTAIIGYLGWLGFMIGMVGGDRKEGYARHHLGQALLINITLSISTVLYLIGLAMIDDGPYYNYYSYSISIIYVIGIIFVLVAVAALIFTFVCWLLGLIRACRGSIKPLPIFSRFRILK